MLPDDRDLVRIAVFLYEHQAILFRTKLNEHGIPAWVTSEGVTAFGAGMLDVEVSIHKANVEEAKKILAKMNLEEEAIPAWTCKCGADVDEGFGVCWSCGADIEEMRKI